jgi:predicted GIY-YIG superfamily endonuclease
MSAGIYQIRNIQNNKRYIGSTHNFEERFYRHRYQLQIGKHHSVLL